MPRGAASGLPQNEHRSFTLGSSRPGPGGRVVLRVYHGTGPRPHNVGLGLYFCRLAVEAHGGKLWLEHNHELPVVFALSLPAARQGRGSAPSLLTGGRRSP